ncbi:MAG TPA: hypothetical protein PLZ36_08105, partial [Armatimonadota bacterium]|nr:hypothetical protein [Armatimonadota bacterium]
MRASLLCLLCALLGLAARAGAAEGLFADDFVVPDVAKVWRLQPPVDALGPIPANAAWSADDGALLGVGSATPWSVMAAGDPAWTDYRVSATITIRTPAPKADYPIFHGEYDRYLPREWFPPHCDHTGAYRFRYFAGEFDWGSDAALYFRYQGRENCYRVQLSTEYQELILWHSVGGYLQVVPCALQPGKPYAVDVQAQGAHIQVSLDGTPLIDYWHQCLPTLAGGIGLGVYNSGVAFQQVRVRALPPAPPMPAHAARFRHRVWRTQPWIFDGNEPICLLETGKTGLSPDYGDGVMMFYFVKLRPGYRPLYQTFVSVRKNEAKTARLTGTEHDVVFTGQGTDRLVFTYDGETSDKVLTTRHTDVLTYDALRGTYKHHITADLTFNADERIFALEFCDPLTYNNKEPGRQVTHRWLPAGHRWGLMRSEDGRITRHPISQSLNLDGQNSWYLQPGHGLWVLYPDRAVCPAWEHLTPHERTYVGVCHWGYDWHQYVHWGDKPREMKAGTKMTITHTFAGYTPLEAERLYNASVLHPQQDKPEAGDRPLNVFKVPSPLGYVVCDPSGTTFDHLVSTREPYVGWQFYGDYQADRDVGRTDRYSMRLDGPAKAVGMMYHHMLEPAQRYQCTLWLKTKGVKGPLTVTLYYPWNPTLPREVVATGLYGDNDWTEVSFTSTIPCITAEQYDASEISVDVQGDGTVWVDDFALLPLADGQPGVEKRPTATPA